MAKGKELNSAVISLHLHMKSEFLMFFLHLQDVTDELKNYQSVMEALHEQAANLGEQVK